jgi:hypothetical protein
MIFYEGFVINMSNLSYTIKRIKRMNISAAFAAVESVCLRCGKPKVFVLLDMIWCGLRYSAGYMDYDVFMMERTNAKQRKTFVTRGINNGFIKLLNDTEYMHYFKNKDEFNIAFAPFICREWMVVNPDSSEKFKNWITGKDLIFIKPRSSMCGKDIQKLKVTHFGSTEELFTYIINSNCELAEECIQQHDHLNELYPDSINTTRIVTVYRNGKAIIVCAYLRIGNGGNFVDNFNSGGMITRVNIETGKLMFDAVDKTGKVYAEHPVTLTAVKGYQIPMWDECLALALHAVAVIPQIGLIGWDIAVTPAGPVLVEGNEFPGHDIYQMPPHTPDNYGLLPLFKKAVYNK